MSYYWFIDKKPVKNGKFPDSVETASFICKPQEPSITPRFDLKIQVVITGKELQTAIIESAPLKTTPRSQTLKNE